MSNYQNGARLERDAAKYLESKGYSVHRSAGSHGVADVVACKAGCNTLYVQAKLRGNLPPAEWNELYREAMKAGAVPVMVMREQHGSRLMGLHWYRLDALKEGQRKQPMTEYEIEE